MKPSSFPPPKIADPRAGRSPRAAKRVTLTALAAAVALASPRATAGDSLYDHDAIGYSAATPENAVTRLSARIESGEAAPARDDQTGWLRSVLRELSVDEATQMLVYSKTSLQRNRIAPRTPRAIYFNDDVYVGYCQGGDVIEVTAADPQLGAVFYTVDQENDDRLTLVRRTDDCLTCHAAAHTNDLPGHLVRSVFTDAGGFPVLSAGSFRTDQTSPLDERWGGWYVTGRHGGQKHLGNLIVRDGKRPSSIPDDTQNVAELAGRVDTSPYLTPHSDLVALMVFEHQTGMHNRLAAANFAAKRALWDEKVLDEAFGDGTDSQRESTTRRIDNAAEQVVEFLLFAGEAKLTGPVSGTSGFTESFAAKGPRDSQGRSLRELDLRTRLFKYPCSYLIYSEAFDGLPDQLRERVYLRVYEVLTGEDAGKTFAHLTADDRRAILEILRDTKPGLPPYWAEGAGEPGPATAASGP